MIDGADVGGRQPLLSRLLQRAFSHYYAGDRLEDAVRAHLRLQESGLSTTLGYWKGDGEAPPATAALYARALDQLAGSSSYVSVQAWGLAFDRGLLDEVAHHGRRRGVLVHYDSLEASWAEAHVRLAEEQAASGVPVGCTIPGRWRRSVEDAARLARAGCIVRVVTGMRDGPPEEAVEPRRGFEAVVERLGAATVPIRLATHDHVLARRVLERLRGRPHVEVELLWGLPLGKMLPLAAELGRPVRIYVPFGRGCIMRGLSALKRSPRLALSLLRGRAELREREVFRASLSSG